MMDNVGGGVLSREAVDDDVGLLLSNMRKKDIDECRAFGMSPGRALRSSMKQSLYAKTYLLDGKIIAMIGLSGPVISNVGCPWMLTGNGIEKVPFAFVRVAMRETDDMLDYRSVLVNHVSAAYPEAVKFFGLVGFTVTAARPFGKDGAPFHQIMKRAKIGRG